MNHGEHGRSFVGVGVPDQFVDGHARALAERERGVVDEYHTDRRTGAGLQHVTLEDRIAGPERDARAVEAGGEDVAVERVHAADRLGRPGGLGLCDLAGRCRSGETRRHVAGDASAQVRCQVGRRLVGEVIPDEDGLAVGPDEQKVRSFAHVFGGLEEGTAGNFDRLGARGVEDDPDVLRRESRTERRLRCLGRLDTRQCSKPDGTFPAGLASPQRHSHHTLSSDTYQLDTDAYYIHLTIFLMHETRGQT